MSEPLAHLTWAKGGHAEIAALEGEGIVLRSTTSAPPGARLESTLVAGGAPVPFKLKSYGTHREADGTFTLKGRLIDVTREVRERISRLLTAP